MWAKSNLTVPPRSQARGRERSKRRVTSFSTVMLERIQSPGAFAGREMVETWHVLCADGFAGAEGLPEEGVQPRGGFFGSRSSTPL